MKLKKLFFMALLPILFLCSCDLSFLNTQDSNDTENNSQNNQSQTTYCNVQFTWNNGINISSVSVPYGSDTYRKPSAEIDGLIFDCWCSDEELTTEFDFSTDITEDITLYARYYIDYEELTNTITLETMKANITLNNTYSYFMGRSTSSSGSGIIYKETSSYYYALTNNHVVYVPSNASSFSLSVLDYQGQDYEAEVIVQDATYDLAVVVFRKSQAQVLKVLEFEESNPEVATKVISLGQPQGQTNAITYGEILQYSTVALSQTDVNVSNVQFTTIQHDAYINSGSSGGALLNTDLKIIGINYAAELHSTTGVHLSSRTIPVEKVKEFLTINESTINSWTY